MENETKQYCVFHIPTSQYLFSHYGGYLAKRAEFPTERQSVPMSAHLLEPGASWDYDTPTRIFRHSSTKVLLHAVEAMIKQESYHYSGRVMEEFEIHSFSLSLVPEKHRWKEVNKDGSLKPTFLGEVGNE